MSKDELLVKAVAHLGARRAAVSGWEYWADEIGAWVRVSEEDVMLLGRMLSARPNDPNVYSEWCASTDCL